MIHSQTGPTDNHLLLTNRLNALFSAASDRWHLWDSDTAP